MQYKNLTPHQIRIGPIVMKPEPGPCPRVVDRTEPVTDGTVAVWWREVQDLPEPEDGVTYVVSRLVAMASGRSDLVFPYDFVRDDEGNIIGCRTFARWKGRWTDGQ